MHIQCWHQCVLQCVLILYTVTIVVFACYAWRVTTACLLSCSCVFLLLYPTDLICWFLVFVYAHLSVCVLASVLVFALHQTTVAEITVKLQEHHKRNQMLKAENIEWAEQSCCIPVVWIILACPFLWALHCSCLFLVLCLVWAAGENWFLSQPGWCAVQTKLCIWCTWVDQLCETRFWCIVDWWPGSKLWWSNLSAVRRLVCLWLWVWVGPTQGCHSVSTAFKK